MFFSCKSVTKEKGKRKLRLADLDKYMDTSSTTMFSHFKNWLSIVEQTMSHFPFLTGDRLSKIEHWRMGKSKFKSALKVTRSDFDFASKLKIIQPREEIILWIKRVKIKVFSGKRMSNLKLNALKDEKMTPRGVTPVSVYSHLFSSFFFQLSDPSSILFQIPASSSQCCKNCYRTFLKKCTH